MTTLPRIEISENNNITYAIMYSELFPRGYQLFNNMDFTTFADFNDEVKMISTRSNAHVKYLNEGVKQ